MASVGIAPIRPNSGVGRVQSLRTGCDTGWFRAKVFGRQAEWGGAPSWTLRAPRERIDAGPAVRWSTAWSWCA